MSRLAEKICTAALGEYKDKGFKAYEEDDHFLAIEHYGEVIAHFFSATATIEEIQKACHQHLNEDILLGKTRIAHLLGRIDEA